MASGVHGGLGRWVPAVVNLPWEPAPPAGTLDLTGPTQGLSQRWQHQVSQLQGWQPRGVVIF